MINPSPSVNIIILNYNGKDLLPACLPSIVEASLQSHYQTKVTVLDNLSTDNSLDVLKKEFPEVTSVSSGANNFLCSYNDYSKKIQDDIVLFLNNDIRVESDFIDPLVLPFVEYPDTFLAAPKVMSFDGSSIEAGPSKAGFKFGMFWCSAKYAGHEKDSNQRCPTFSSGFGAFSRAKFNELGGYDALYLPGIMEDVDLCLRASRRGYRLLYIPESTVYHMGQASFTKAFGKNGISKIAHRNNFLFMWKNYSSLSFWITHLFYLPLRLLFALIKGNISFLVGFREAFYKKIFR